MGTKTKILTGFAIGTATLYFTSTILRAEADAQGTLIEGWPKPYVRNNGERYDVRVFIQPGDPAVQVIAGDLWGDTGEEQAFFVATIDYVYQHITYSFDTGEYWQYPSETLAVEQGDCEDMAILAQSILENYIPKDRVFVAVGIAGGIGHAWERYQTSAGEYWIGETTAGKVGLSRDMGYDTWHWFNSEHTYT